MYKVYQHWDPLKVCAVGRSYPPEYYKWIQNARVRRLFERIATETEEDYQAIIATLQSFGVEIVRPCIDHIQDARNSSFMPPPMNPRDSMIIIGTKFYTQLKGWQQFYDSVKDPSWPIVRSIDDLDKDKKEECLQRGWANLDLENAVWQPVYDKVRAAGNDIICCHEQPYINGAGVSRIGKDLYVAVATGGPMTLPAPATSKFSSPHVQSHLQSWLANQFSEWRTHMIETIGHGDGTYCPVCPGLIISLRDIPTYAKTFPGWEVIYLPDQSWDLVKPFLDLKKRNAGRWWIPGWEYDTDVVTTVETWLTKWVGYVEETVFDVNMLVVDRKNVLVFNENEKVFRALERYGMTPHVVPFRHRYFWDGGIHCVTLDLNRDGVMEDYFPNRS